MGIPHHGPELIGGHSPVIVGPSHGQGIGGGLSASGANAAANTQSLTTGLFCFLFYKIDKRYSTLLIVWFFRFV